MADWNYFDITLRCQLRLYRVV